VNYNKTFIITITYNETQQITVSPKTSINTCFIKKTIQPGKTIEKTQKSLNKLNKQEKSKKIKHVLD